MLPWIIIAIVVVLGAIFLMGFHRITPPRLVSFEAMENPEVARDYDRISRWPQFKALRLLIVRELQRHRPAGTLADVGCGPGYLIATIAGKFPDLKLIGVDIAEEMVKRASGNLAASGYGNRVEFRQGDVQKLPFADAELDFVISTLSLHHWPEPQQALEEIYRVLKPGGQFLLFDLRRDNWRGVYWVLWFAQNVVLPVSMRRMNEPRVSMVSGYMPAEMEKLVSAIPLAEHEIKPGLAWLYGWGKK